MKNPIIYLLPLLLLFACECETLEVQQGPVPGLCKGGNFYTSRVLSVGLESPRWFIDSIDSPIPEPFRSTLLEEISENTSKLPFLAHNSAYDQENDRYVFAYYLDLLNGNFTTHYLQVVDTEPYNSTLLTLTESYVAPVFLHGKLYGINAFNDNGTQSYEILEIDQNSGTSSVLHSDTFPKYRLVNEWFSSASDGSDQLYFLAKDELMSFDVNTQSVEFYRLENDSTELYNYYGLEYQEDGDRLLALRATNTEVELVAIPKNAPSAWVSLFDVEYFGPSSGGFPFSQYSTTYDPCENRYYLTVPTSYDNWPFPEEAHISIIDLAVDSQRSLPTNAFYFGIEYNKN